MTTDSALDAGRLAAEGRMTSRCTVRRDGAMVVTDDIESPGWATIQTNLPCRLGGSGQSRTVTVGSTEVEVAVRVLHVPAGTAGVADGDLVEITSGENAGLVLEVVEAAWQDQATALRLPVIEAQRPEEW